MTTVRSCAAHRRRGPAPGRALLVLLPLVLPLLLVGPAARAAPDPGRAVPPPPPTSPGAVEVRAAGSTVPAPVADDRWSWPLVGEPAVVRPFDPPAQRWSPGHRGVDLASAPRAAVLSPAAGRVVVAGRVVDRGVVVVEHAGGLRTTLEPVEDAPVVGTAVARGDVVGRLASRGAHCPGCLHWGVRRGVGRSGVYLDPLSLLAPPAPPVLLPLPPTAGVT